MVAILFLADLLLQSVEETCWDEPREQCTEQRVKVARKWCHVEEPITGNEVW